MTDVSIKKVLYERLLQFFQERISGIQQQLDAAQEAANNETKSSAGDKYETERAMQQLNKEMFSKQLAAAFQEKEQALQTYSNFKLGVAGPGALVETTAGNFFIISGLGKVIIEGKEYYVVAPNAPIALQLRGKNKGETFQFKNSEQTIVSIL